MEPQYFQSVVCLGEPNPKQAKALTRLANLVDPDGAPL